MMSVQQVQAAVVEKLMGSALGRKAAAEVRAAELAERRERVAVIEKLTAERDRQLPQLRAAEGSAMKKFEAAQEALKLAGEELRRARQETWGASSSFDHSIGREQVALRATADPLIGVFADEMEKAKTELRSCQGAALGKWVRGWERPEYVLGASDVPLRVAMIAALEAAKQKARGLELQACEDVPGAIAAIRDELQKAHEAAHVAHEKAVA